MTSAERKSRDDTRFRYPIRRLRVAFSGLLFLFGLFFIGGSVLTFPTVAMVEEYGAVGWILGLAAAILLVLVFSYYSYRQLVGSLLTDTEEVTRESHPELVDTLEFIEAEAQKRGMATPDLHINSAPTVNAAAVGRKGDGHIILHSGILTELDNKEELNAVIGHEIAHLANRDSTLVTLMSGTKELVIRFWTWVGYAAKKGYYQRRGVILGPSEEKALKQKARRRSELICSPIGLFENSVSRHREYIADLDGARMADPEAMIGALESIDSSDYDPTGSRIPQSLCIHGSHDGLFARLRSDHPPISRRIKNIKKKYPETHDDS